MLQYLHVIPVEGMVLCPGVFSYGRLVHEAFDTSFLILFQTCFESTCRLADVHLSAGARYFTDNVCLLPHREGALDLSEERTEGGSRLEHRSDVEVLTHPPVVNVFVMYYVYEVSGPSQLIESADSTTCTTHR